MRLTNTKRRAIGFMVTGLAGLATAIVGVIAQGTLPGLTDALAHPPPTTGPFAYSTFAPANGQSYVDPVFGSTVRRITGDSKDDDLYSRNMWWNADATKYFHYGNIVDTTTGAVTHTVPRGSSSSDAGFDPVNPNVVYYYLGSTIHKVTLGSGGTTTDVVWLTVPSTVNPMGGSENWISSDGRLIVVSYGAEPSVHVFDTQNLAAGPFAGAVPAGTGGGYSLITPSGHNVVTAGSGLRSYPIDLANRTVDATGKLFWNLCGDHAAYISPSDGRDYAVSFDCSSQYDVWRINVANNVTGFTGAQQHAAPFNQDLWPAVSTTYSAHLAATARGVYRDWAFMNTELGSNNPASWPAFQSEIIALNVITGERRRIAHHRSNVTSDYFTQPRISASWGGELIGWASNFQTANINVYTAVFGGLGGGGDITPPTVSMTAPAANATLTGATTVSATAADDTGVVGVQFKANGANIGSEVTTAPYSISWNSASVADGAYSLTATARDAAGNSTTSAAVAVTVANLPPVISAVSGSGLTATTAAIAWTTNQLADSQVDYGTTTAYGSSSALVTTLVTAHSQTLSGLTTNATYHYRVRSANALAQSSVSGDFTFVAAAPPTISAITATGITGTAATIGWTTDQASDSQVDYGPTTSYGTSTTVNAALVTTHSQALSGLANGTTYHYRVKSRNASGGLGTSADNTFVTAAAPVISAVATSNVTGTTATATWTTNQTADSQVDYGLTTAYGSSTTLDATLVTAHSQSLAGLTPGSTYHFRVKSKNAAGLLATSADATFATPGPPSISGVSASAITGTTATIGWTTSQAADSQVDFGPTTAYGTTTLNATLTTTHAQAVSGLATGTIYHYRVKSKNAVALLATSGDFTFTTIAPPAITAVSAGNLTGTSATITWTTDQTADSQIDYGPTTTYGSSTTLDTLLVTSHGRTLTGLTAATSYHYRVKSRNAAGLLTTSGDFAFTTTSGGGSSVSLAVTIAGSGTGSVIAPLAGISCGSVCAGAVAAGTSVTLTAIPAPGSAFRGWSGACASSGSALSCTISVAAAATVTATFSPSTRGDFDGDGYADLIWQRDDGTLALWTMRGNVRASVSDIAPRVVEGGADWQIVNPGSDVTAGEDPGTGGTGSLATWRHGSTAGLLSAVYLSIQSRIIDPDWHIVATPDLNGDGKADVLWQHAVTGKLAAWIMDGPVKVGGSFLVPDSVDPNSTWHVQGTGDFNGDGKDDIVLQQLATGLLTVWFMDGTMRIGERAISPGSVATQWRMVGTGDFDGDGQTDLVWQNQDTGDVYVWLMNGTSMRLQQSLGQFGGPAWQVVAVGDFDGDGRPDLIWEKTTGELAVWFMNGTLLNSSVALAPGSVDPKWRIVGVK